MLAGFRAFSKTWAAKGIFLVLLVGFTVWGVQGGVQMFVHVNPNVVTAGDRHLSKKEFYDMIQQQLNQVRQQGGEAPTAEQLVHDGEAQQLANQLGQDMSFQEWVEKSGIHPDKSLISQAINEIPALRNNGNIFNPVTGAFNEEGLKAVLSQVGLTEDAFKKQLQDSIAAQSLASGMRASLRTPRTYAAVIADVQLQTRDASFFLLDIKSLGEPPKPTDQDLQKLYANLAVQLRHEETRSLAVAIFDPRLVVGSVSVSPDEVKATYEFRKGNYAVPETRTFVVLQTRDAAAAVKAVEAMKAGKSADDAAKLAGAQISPQNGLPRSAITDAKIGTPAFSLKAGEVSAPIAMPQGFAVVKVVSITAAHVAPFEEKKGEIENALREIAAKRAVEKQVQTYNEAVGQGASFDQAVAKAGVKVDVLPLMTAEGRVYSGPQPRVTPDLQQIVQQGFKLQPKATDDAHQMKGGVYYAVAVKEQKPPYTPKLDEVRSGLEIEYAKAGLAKMLQSKSDELVSRLKRGEPIAQVAASIKAEVKALKGVQRPGGQLSSDDDVALAMIFQGSKGVPFANKFKRDGSAMLIGVVEAVHGPTPEQAGLYAARIQRPLDDMYFKGMSQQIRSAAIHEVKAVVDPTNVAAALNVSPAGAPSQPAQ